MFALKACTAALVVSIVSGASGLASAPATLSEVAPEISWETEQAEITAFVERAMAELGVVPGLALAVSTPSGRYARGFGVAHVETGQPVDEDTTFYIASATKSFTGLAMNILHNRGALDLDASIADFAPQAPFPDTIDTRAIRLRNLLSHSHGIEHFPFGFRFAYSGEHDRESMWALLGAARLNSDAPLGTFEYTNIGYNMLTLMTDRELGSDWQDLLEREIYAPAGMTRTS